MTRPRKVHYATKAAIERLVPVLIETAKEAGMPVGGVEICPDGTIRVIQTPAATPSTDFDRWEAEQNQR